MNESFLTHRKVGTEAIKTASKMTIEKAAEATGVGLLKRILTKTKKSPH